MFKTGQTLLVVASLLIMACCNVLAKERVSPSGNEISNEMSLSNFDKIIVNGSFEVTYEVGSTPGAVVTGSDNLVPLVKVEVEGSTLSIGFKRNVNVNQNDVVVRVVAPSVTKYVVNGSGGLYVVSALKMQRESIKTEVNGSGDIKLTEYVECQSFDGTVNGSGDIDLPSTLKASKWIGLTVNGSGDIAADALNCAEFGAAVNGSGDLAVETVDAKLCKVSLSGSGDLDCSDIDAASVEAKLSGSGDIYIDGKAASATIEVATSGSVDASDLIANEVYATVSGSGDIECHAVKTLNATVNGSGDITYDGSPRVSKYGYNSHNVHKN